MNVLPEVIKMVTQPKEAAKVVLKRELLPPVTDPTYFTEEEVSARIFQRTKPFYYLFAAVLSVTFVFGVYEIISSLNGVGGLFSMAHMIFLLALCAFLGLELLAAIYVDRRGISDL